MCKDLRSLSSFPGCQSDRFWCVYGKNRNFDFCRNYKTAIPMYFPTRNIMSLLFPLALVDDNQVDIA